MNKKNITLTIIAVITLLVVVVSATFAYFTAIINTEGNSTTIVSGSAESVGTVALSNPTEDLHITLSATDMAEDNLGVYYATDSTTANYDTTEVQRNIAVAVVSGGSASTKYECSATINIALSGTMAESLVAGDAYVQFGGIIDDKVHLSKVASDGYKVVFQLDGNINTSKSVSASIAVENKRQNQNNLAGKTLSATFSNDDFECKVVKEYSDTSKTAFAIYSETDNSLKFYKRENVPEVGETYNGNKVTAIYNGFEEDTYEYKNIIGQITTTIPWYEYAENITSVEVVDEISPVSTVFWFINFKNCITIDVTNLDVSNVTDMSHMFNYSGSNVTTFEIIGLEGWDTSNVTSMLWTFKYAGQEAATFNIGDISSWDTASVNDMSNMFAYAGQEATTFNIGDLSKWDTSNVTDMSQMFDDAGESATTWNIGDLSKWDTSNVTDMIMMFYFAGNKATIFDIGDISSWDTSKVTRMNAMFSNTAPNADWSLDLSNWNVSKVTSYSNFNKNTESKVTPPKWVTTS